MELKYDDELGYYVVFSRTPWEVCFLGHDEDEAKRLYALRCVLDDWKTDMRVIRGNTVEVNPHNKFDGISPEEARAKVTWVKECLAKVNWYNPGAWAPLINAPVFHLQTLDQLREIGYESLKQCVERDCPEEVAKGCHDLVNLLYTLTSRKGSYAREHDYINTIREAWDGMPEDRRTSFATNDGEYLVVTDDEADRMWDEDLENYIDECLEIPASVARYFDREKWKRDAKRDGRAHSLNRYDGREDSVEVEGETYFIYRQN